MSIFKYIYFIGIINLLFGFVWKWVVLLPTTLLFTWLEIPKAGTFIKIIGSYFLVSLTAVLASYATQEKGVIISIIFYFIGGFTLFMSFASNTYENRKVAYQTDDYELLNLIEFDALITVGSILLYILIVLVPIVGINILTIRFIEFTYWALDIKIIGWLIGFGGFLFLISMLYYGVISASLLMFSISNIFNKKIHTDFGISDYNNVAEDQSNNSIPSQSKLELVDKIHKNEQGNLIISATNKTPEVNFKTNGILWIKGRSIPEDAGLFYYKIEDWIREYCMNPAHETTINIMLEYFNEGGFKNLLQILSDLKKLKEQGHSLKINWFYDEVDQDMKELIEMFAGSLKTPINILPLDAGITF